MSLTKDVDQSRIKAGCSYNGYWNQSEKYHESSGNFLGADTYMHVEMTT